MAAHDSSDPDETRFGPESPSECSRRRFLTYSAAGAAGSFLLPGVPGAFTTSQGPPPFTDPFAAPLDAEVIIQATPSEYFVSRGAGEREMKWGPVSEYGDTVPNDRFFIHNRARPPQIDRDAWRLKLTGDALTRPRSFGYEDLLKLPQVTLRRTLDCGANCSSFFPKLPPEGAQGRWLPTGFTQWHFGAVGAAEWTGVRARDVLAAAGAENPRDIRFTGLDQIAFEGGRVHYTQVIPAAKVLADDTLLVYRMNGKDLPADHGYPLRLLPSGWGANTAVKWLGEIEASKQRIPASGPQRNQVITGPSYAKPIRPTVGRVRSAIELDDEVTFMPGDLTLRGRAWSGAAAIRRVDVAVERMLAPGRWAQVLPWREARLLSRPEPLMWVRFELPWRNVRPAQYRVMSRARDDAGNVQPAPGKVPWNQHGLGYNGHHPLYLVVLPPSDKV